jgi:hypothetical protein
MEQGGWGGGGRQGELVVPYVPTRLFQVADPTAVMMLIMNLAVASWAALLAAVNADVL